MGRVERVVVLLSGGVDSTTLLAKALDDGMDCSALSVQYGQKHEMEVVCAATIANEFDVEHTVVQLPAVFEGTGSSLIEGEMPHLSYEEIQEAEGPSPTYVPFRNANMISLAVTFALTTDATAVYYAPHAEDARNFAYPDCTPEFNGAMAAAVYVGTYHRVSLRTPFQWLRKHEIVRIGADLDVPFELTMSCYEGTRPACGKCPTCVARVEAFRLAEVPDPIPYAVAV